MLPNSDDMNALTETLSDEDWGLLRAAHRHLEHPSLAARLTSVVGTPMEIAFKLLPKRWYDRLHGAVERAIAKALDTAISSLRPEEHYAHDNFYRLLCMGAGAAGGFVGLPGLLVELPISTTIMLRSIADIARAKGEDLDSLEARLACMKVFALGGRTEEDDAADTGYYGLRFALAVPVSRAADHVAQRGLVKEGAPVLVNLISNISSRFGVAISEKVAAQAVPIIGAAGAAAINAIFMQHFQDMARSHFTVRCLERRYGAEIIRRAYESID